jgi:hypothetical protein
LQAFIPTVTDFSRSASQLTGRFRDKWKMHRSQRKGKNLPDSGESAQSLLFEASASQCTTPIVLNVEPSVPAEEWVNHRSTLSIQSSDEDWGVVMEYNGPIPVDWTDVLRMDVKEHETDGSSTVADDPMEMIKFLTPPLLLSNAIDMDEEVYHSKLGEAQVITIFKRRGASQKVTLSLLQYGAEFFLSCGLWKQASRLYLLLCRIYQKFRPIPQRKCMMALVTGVRCAILEAGLDLAEWEALVRHWAANAEEFAFTIFDQWMLRMLCLQIQTQPTSSSTEPALRQFINDLPQGLGKLLDQPGEAFRSFMRKVHTIFYIVNSHGNTSEMEGVSLVAINARFQQYILEPSTAVPLDRDDLLEQTEHIRECLDWIVMELSHGSNIRDNWSNFRRSSTIARDADTAVLFFFLCSRWIEGGFGKDNAMDRENNSIDAYRVVPDLETIKVLTICIMRLDSPRTRLATLDVPRKLVEKSWSLRRRAQSGAKILSSESDEFLISTFLNHFTYYAWDTNNGMREDHENWLDQPISNLFVLEFLRIDLSDIAEGGSLDILEVKIEGYDPKTQIPSVDPPMRNSCDLFPTRATSMLASTLSSSDLSSLRHAAFRASSWVAVSSESPQSKAVKIDKFSEAFKVITIRE